MKKIARLLLAGFGLVVSASAVADNGYDLFSGVSLSSVRSYANGVTNTSAGLAGILSARRTDKHYGFELQGGYFGRGGQFTPNIEFDLSAIGLLPLGGSGINLYGRIGLADFITHVSSNFAVLTYGAGVEFQSAKSVFRLGWQHFNVGGNVQPSSTRINVIGVAVLVLQD